MRWLQATMTVWYCVACFPMTRTSICQVILRVGAFVVLTHTFFSPPQEPHPHLWALWGDGSGCLPFILPRHGRCPQNVPYEVSQVHKQNHPVTHDFKISFQDNFVGSNNHAERFIFLFHCWLLLISHFACLFSLFEDLAEHKATFVKVWKAFFWQICRHPWLLDPSGGFSYITQCRQPFESFMFSVWWCFSFIISLKIRWLLSSVTGNFHFRGRAKHKRCYTNEFLCPKEKNRKHWGSLAQEFTRYFPLSPLFIGFPWICLSFLTFFIHLFCVPDSSFCFVLSKLFLSLPL